MTRTQIYLPKSQLDALRKRARYESTTMSELLRRMLDVQLRMEKQEKQATSRHESLSDAFRRISKIGKPGPKDLAKNLDHYLYGAPKHR